MFPGVKWKPLSCQVLFKAKTFRSQGKSHKNQTMPTYSRVYHWRRLWGPCFTEGWWQDTQSKRICGCQGQKKKMDKQKVALSPHLCPALLKTCGVFENLETNRQAWLCTIKKKKSQCARHFCDRNLSIHSANAHKWAMWTPLLLFTLR